MAQEFAQPTFFSPASHSDVYHAALLPLEFFLSQVLLRGDMSRIFWSSDDIAFRKRFQNANLTNGGDFTKISPSTLNFPFANYWYAGGLWVPDDRPFVMQASQMINGVWTDGFPAYLRAMAVKTSFDVTAYYDRDDDARLGYEMMMWEQQPKGPVQFSTTVTWHGILIAIPVFFTIDMLEYNPQYKEGDWLKQQRILPVKMKVIARTYIIYFPKQTNLDGSQRLSSPFSTGVSLWQDPDSVYLTEEAILNFAAAKQWGKLSDIHIQPSVRIEETPIDGADTTSDILNVASITTDIVHGYFQASTEVSVNAVIVDPTTITTNSFVVSWQVKPADIDKLASVRILVPGQSPAWIEDSTIHAYTMADLYPASNYDITILFYSVSGAITTFKLNVTTLPDSTTLDILPVKRMGKLRGMEW